MPSQEFRRTVNQPTMTKSQAEWEQLRRALLMIVAQFKESDPQGCYTVEVKVVQRDRVKVSS